MGCSKERNDEATGAVTKAPLIENEVNEKNANDTMSGNATNKNNDLDFDESASGQEENSQIIIIESENFSNECAWLTYSIDEKRYLGCIDKTGTVLFYYLEEEINQHTEFQNETAYILFANKDAAIIDKRGNVVYSITNNMLGNLGPYGDGYYCFTKQYADFDSSGIITTIIDGTGKVLYEIDDMKSFYQYAGEGVFYGFNTKNRETYWYYNVREDIFFECNDMGSNNFNKINEFDNGTAHFILGADGRIIDLKEALVTSKGEVKILSMPECGDAYIRQWWGGKVSEDAVVFMTSDPNPNGYDSVLAMCYYDIEKEKFVSMNQYIDKMYSDFINNEELHFSNNRVVIPLLGDDFNLYVAIFDREWKEVMKPTKYVFSPDNSLVYNCGRLVINLGEGDVVLDENGNIIAEASSLECDAIGAYANDVAKIGEGKYIDKEGNVLFENIDITQIK